MTHPAERDIEREAFEKWATTWPQSGPGMHKDRDGDYRDALVLAWWQAWQARAAQATAEPVAPPVTPKHIEEIKDILLWPVTEDDAKTVRDMLQSLHFDLSMAEGAAPDRAPSTDSAADARDAARYRWLRDQMCVTRTQKVSGQRDAVPMLGLEHPIPAPNHKMSWFGSKWESSVDAAIDAAIAAMQKEG